MEEAEDQDPDDVTTEEIFDLIGNVDAIYDQLKEVEILKYKFKRSKKAKEIAEKKRDEYQDLLRRSESENYELKKSNISLDQHNQLLKEFNDLKAEHHELVNWAEIRYQKVNQELIDIKDKHNALEKEYSELKDHSNKGQALQPIKSARTRIKKHIDVKVQLQQEDILDDSTQLEDLQETGNDELNQLSEFTTKFNILQERYNKVITLNDQLQKEIGENDSKYQKKIHDFTGQVRNRDAEIRKLVEKLDILHLQISLPREDPILTNSDTIESKNLPDSMPMLFNDNNEVERRKETPVQLQQQNGAEESQKMAELERLASKEHNRVKELTDKLAALKEFHQNEMKVLKDRMQKQFKENNIKNQKTIDSLNESLRHKDAEAKTLVEELNSLHLQINLLKEDLELANSRRVENLPAFDDATNVPHLQPQHISGDETSDPATDEINTIIKEMKHSIKLISPLPFESTTKAKEAQPIAEQDTLNVFVNRLNRKLIMKQKELKMSNKRLCISRRNLTEAKKESWLKNNELIVTKKELCLLKNELRMLKNKLHVMKRYANLKRANRNCNRVCRDQATQCTETTSKIEGSIGLPSSPHPDMTPTEKKAFTQQMKLKKFLKQQLLDDIRKWHTDSFLSYPSAESDMESGLSQSTIRRKKFRKLKHKQLVHDSSDEDEVALSKEILKKKEKPEKITTPSLNEAEADVASSETIYAKVQGSVDSGYVKTDSGEESEVQNGKRKFPENLTETGRKRRCTKISNTKETGPKTPADVKRWTRAMVKLFGTDSESCSPKTLTVVTQKPMERYLERVELEKSVYPDESSDSDCLRGFVNGRYSSVPKRYVLGANPLNIATVTTNINASRLTKKQKKVTKQKQKTPSKDQNINLVLNDLHLSEDYSTTCTETEANTRNVLLNDGTQSLTCTVISNKALSTPTSRRNPKKVKPNTQVPIKMTLRSASKKTDDESAKSSSDCRTSHNDPGKQLFNAILQETKSTQNAEIIIHTQNKENTADSVTGGLAKQIAEKQNCGFVRIDCRKLQNKSCFNSENNKVCIVNSGDKIKPIGENNVEAKTSSDEYATNNKTRRMSSRIAEIKARSGTDEEKSLSSNKTSGNKKRKASIGKLEVKAVPEIEEKSVVHCNNSESKVRIGKSETDEKSISSFKGREINGQALRTSMFEESATNNNCGNGDTVHDGKSETIVQNCVTSSESLNIRRSRRISARKSKGKSATDDEKSMSYSIQSATDEDSSTNTNSKNKDKLFITSTKRSGTAKDKTGTSSIQSVTDEDSSTNTNSKNKDKLFITSTKRSGTAKDKTGTSSIQSVTDEDSSTNTNSKNNEKLFITSTKRSGTAKDKTGTSSIQSVTDEDSSTNTNSKNKDKLFITSTKRSGTAKDKTGTSSIQSATDEDSSTNTNSKNNEKLFITSTKRSGTAKDKTGTSSIQSVTDEDSSTNTNSKNNEKLFITSTKRSGTAKDKTGTSSIQSVTDEDSSTNTNSKNKDKLFITSVKPSGTAKDKTGTSSIQSVTDEDSSTNTNSKNKDKIFITSAKPSGTAKDKTRTESESLNNNIKSETKRSLRISARNSGDESFVKGPNTNVKGRSVEPPSEAKTSGPSSDVRNATSRLPDLPTLELANLPSLDSISFESPASPSLACESQHFFDVGPKIIPMEPQNAKRSQTRSLLNQLLHYCRSGAMAQEVTNALLCENPHFIAKLILEVTSQDIHAKAELFNYRRAPLLTIIQRLMLGLLLDLEEKGLKGVINNFLILSEQFLLTLRDPSHISPTARLHAAICKLQFDYKRMRLMLCKALFFMGDAAIPYLYIVLCSWFELLPLNNDNLSGNDALETRTLIQLIRLKQCTEPKYNQHNLQTLLNKYYGYSFDREDSEKLLEDLIKCFVRRNRLVQEDANAESMMYLVLTLCESLNKTVVFKQLDRLKMCLAVATTNLEMYNIIYLVGVITSQYCEDADVCANVSDTKEWLQQFCSDSYSECVSNAATDVLRKF